MSPEQQHLEDFFQSMKPGDGLPGDFEMNDEKAEFDAFFEKLSSLDDLNITDEPEIPAGETWVASPSPARPRSAGRKPPVYKSETAPSRPVQSRTEGGNIGRYVQTGIKFLMMACVLFSFGMGAGWLALSLPERFSKAAPIASAADEQAETTQIIQTIPQDSSKGEGELTLVETPVRVEASESRQAALPVATPVPAGVPAPTVRTPSAPVVRTPPAKPAQPLLSRAGGFSLQVGACSSEQCVDRYRKILSAHVNAEKIQVMRKGSAEEGNLILRVRIAPLERPDADSLKNRLATVDNHFKDAYVIAIN